MYDEKEFLKAESIEITEETRELMKKADEIYKENHDNKTWFGRCLFLSFYCALGDCDFCYRSTIQDKIESPPSARRTIPSVLVEALFCKTFNWRIEFLTGGIGIFPFNTLLEIMDYSSRVFGDKVWVNLGLFGKHQLTRMKPFVKGICASIETANPRIHDKVAPSKPLDTYEKMLIQSKEMGFKTSIAVVVGLGEERKEISHLIDFIKRTNIDRIILFPLKPIKGTPYEKGPSTDEFIWWLSTLRINFPKLEIISGSNLRRSEELGIVMKSGANAFGKFPASKYFGKPEAKKIESLIKSSGRDWVSNLSVLPKIDWMKEIDELNLPEEIKSEMKIKIVPYINRFKRNTSNEIVVLN